MTEYSKTAWDIASRYSDVLASETRDLAAQIDEALAVQRELCAIMAERFYVVEVPTEQEHARDVGEMAGKQIAEAIRGHARLP